MLQKRERGRKNLREVFRENLGTPHEYTVSIWRPVTERAVRVGRSELVY